MAIIAAYGVLFASLHHFANLWATDRFFSLWFPGAGLRFAFLWTVGPRWSPLASLSEVGAQFLIGEVSAPINPLSLFGMAAPCLAYGLAIWLVRYSFRNRRSSHFVVEHEAMLVASFAGALLACLTALPGFLFDQLVGKTLPVREIIVSLLIFSLGDLLGVLTIAIPILWLRQREMHLWQRTKDAVAANWMELSLVYLVSWGVVAAIYWVGMGFTLLPVLLASCWMSFRAGRIVAWMTFVVTTITTLPISSLLVSEVDRMRAHLLLASIALIGYMVASFAEAEELARREIQRRDRLLYQADRLKTLRAMSLAVIHEISQPLSTIALEARGLSQRLSAAQPDGEEAKAIQLISKKAADLSVLTTHLRKFGSRVADSPAYASLSSVVRGAISLAEPDAKRRNVRLNTPSVEPVTVIGHDIELRQALLNLLMNAIAASGRNGVVDVKADKNQGSICITVINEDKPAAPRAGMGIGLIITRAIAEANGGSLREESSDGKRQFTLEVKVSPGDGDE